MTQKINWRKGKFDKFFSIFEFNEHDDWKRPLTDNSILAICLIRDQDIEHPYSFLGLEKEVFDNILKLKESYSKYNYSGLVTWSAVQGNTFPGLYPKAHLKYVHEIFYGMDQDSTCN